MVHPIHADCVYPHPTMQAVLVTAWWVRCDSVVGSHDDKTCCWDFLVKQNGEWTRPSTPRSLLPHLEDSGLLGSVSWIWIVGVGEGIRVISIMTVLRRGQDAPNMVWESTRCLILKPFKHNANFAKHTRQLSKTRFRRPKVTGFQLSLWWYTFSRLHPSIVHIHASSSLLCIVCEFLQSCRQFLLHLLHCMMWLLRQIAHGPSRPCITWLDLSDCT